MNLLQTNENFGNLSQKEKINLLKGITASQSLGGQKRELKFTVIADANGNYYLLPGGEFIALPAGETIEQYLGKQYPLNRVGLQKISIENIGKNNGRNHAAA